MASRKLTNGRKGGGALKRSEASASAAGSFLADLPPELDAVLQYAADTGTHQNATQPVRVFAESFLDALTHDQALIPRSDGSAVRLLGLVLTHHQHRPEAPAGWLNLGLVLRRLAVSDRQASAKHVRLQKSLQCFDRSLDLGPSEPSVRIRAWAGKSLAFRQLGQFDEAAQSSLQALELDRSDPALWLLHSAAVAAAGRTDDALVLVADAHEAYVKAGRPQGLRYLFEDAGAKPTN